MLDQRISRCNHQRPSTSSLPELHSRTKTSYSRATITFGQSDLEGSAILGMRRSEGHAGDDIVEGMQVGEKTSEAGPLSEGQKKTKDQPWKFTFLVLAVLVALLAGMGWSYLACRQRKEKPFPVPVAVVLAFQPQDPFSKAGW